jgi:hypothetical protein
VQVLFDLQKEFETYELGELDGTEHVVPIGDLHPTLSVEVVDSVKTILVKDRADQNAGLGVPLSALPQLRAGDRITVTGRVPRDLPTGSWGVALVTEETETRLAEECQLAHFAAPKSLFALSHILNSEDLENLIMVQTTRWGAINPIMDFYIDSILIFRDNRYVSFKEDTRNIIYDLNEDEKVFPGAIIESGDARDLAGLAAKGELLQSGAPDIRIFKRGNTNAIHVGARAKDWDGIDINMQKLGLMPGNKYEVVATGCIDGKSVPDCIITLQGIPGYSWRNNQYVGDNEVFTLRHTLTQAEVGQWNVIRITTNASGATVPFYIYSIEIRRLGLL